MAQEFQRRVLVIDADLRHPRVHELLGLEAGPGTRRRAHGTATLEDALVEIPEQHLTVLRAGRAYDRPAEMLGSGPMRRLIDTLRTQFDRDRDRFGAGGRLRPGRDRAARRWPAARRARRRRRPSPRSRVRIGSLGSSKLLGLVFNESGAPLEAPYGSERMNALALDGARRTGPGSCSCNCSNVRSRLAGSRRSASRSCSLSARCCSPRGSSVRADDSGDRLAHPAGHGSLSRLPLLQRLLRPDSRAVGARNRRPPAAGRRRRLDHPGGDLFRACRRSRCAAAPSSRRLRSFIAATLTWRFAFNVVIRAPRLVENMLIVGTGSMAVAVARQIFQQHDFAYHIVGFRRRRPGDRSCRPAIREVIGEPTDARALVDALRRAIASSSPYPDRRGGLPVQRAGARQAVGRARRGGDDDLRAADRQGHAGEPQAELGLIFSDGFRVSRIRRLLKRLVDIVLSFGRAGPVGRCRWR